jgi:5-methylcytosine-specific restriction protein A
MEFGPVQKDYFKASVGAYSKVTGREVYDSQITLTGKEVEIVDEFFGPDGIHHGPVKSNRAAALKEFMLYTQGGEPKRISLNLVYCKEDKSELRLYLKGKVFMPKADSIWFLFVSNGEIFIGAMPVEKWTSIGREDAEDDGYIAEIYDEAIAPQQKQTAGSLIWKRNPRLAIARFEFVGYQCEADPNHKLFKSRSTGMPFLEAHHLLPMKYQWSFKNSLDVSDNIVALCPFCHRLIHHATVEETRPMLDTVLSKHTALVDRYKITKLNLYRFYNCEDIVASE